MRPILFAGSSLRTHLRPIAALAALTIVASACHGNAVQVSTLVAPGTQFAGRSTFRILPTPPAHGVTLTRSDPMLTNSITYQAIRDEIRHDFESRGYTYADQGADLDVAYYATAQAKLDITTWDYGYTWRGFPRQRVDVEPFEQGTVLVDVIDPHTHDLLWRGQGVAQVSTDPTKYAAELRKAADAIITKFPAH